MEEQIKAKLLEKLKEKNARKFNGYTLGLHANHIAVAVLRAKGIKKGSAEFEEQHPKLKELVKSIHKDLPAQAVDKTVKKESKAPPSIPPAQLAKETSSVQEEVVAPTTASSDELKAVKAELKTLKTLLASSKTLKGELADKIATTFKRYKQMKDAKTELSGLKQKATDDKLERIKGRLEVVTAVKRVKKALTKNVETKKAEKVKAEKEKAEKEMESKPKTLTQEEFRERMRKSREAKAKEKAPEPLYDLKHELSLETIKEKYKVLSDTQHRLIHIFYKYITPPEKPSLRKQANNIYLEMLSIYHMVNDGLKYDKQPIPSWAKHLASVAKQMIEGRPDFKTDNKTDEDKFKLFYINSALGSIKYILTH